MARMQDTLVAGDTVDFGRNAISGYPSAEWTLKYRLTPRTIGVTAVDITASADGDGWRVQVGPAASALWTAGEYGWNCWLEKTGARYSVDSGQVTIKPNPATLAAGTDTRSQAQIALADAKAALASFQASGGRVKSYTVAGRQMEFETAGDIVRLVSYWQIEVARESAATAKAAGLADPRRILIRMSNA